jgi:hypothetical protein
VVFGNWTSVTGGQNSLMGLPAYVDLWTALAWAVAAIVPASRKAKYFAAPTTPMMCCSSRMSPMYRRPAPRSSEMKSLMEKSGVVGSPSIRSAAAA